MNGDDESDQAPDSPQPPITVPPEELSQSTLTAVIESFVLREGTDYGERDVPFETKVMQVRRQIERGEARIVYDPVSESVDIVTSR